MNDSSLIDPKHLMQAECQPCEGLSSLSPEEYAAYLDSVAQWQVESLSGVPTLVREFVAENFVDAVRMVQEISEIAEFDNHHPDLHLTRYKHLRVELTTHVLDGLSVNDFIVAAKINTHFDQ